MNRLLKGAALTSAALLTLFQSPAGVARAKDFDLSGTLDCGVTSGAECTFADWAAGPTFGVLTDDISGTTQRVVVDASWVREDLTEFGQDDYVWFIVRDAVGKNLQVISVVEHRCKDGTMNPGRSSAVKCFRENGEPVDEDD